MNTKKIPYDRLSVGERIYQRRKQLGYSQLELATLIDRSVKYYADIERGSCGMSVETLIALSQCLDMSLDHVIFGPTEEKPKKENEGMVDTVLAHLEGLDPLRQEYALHILSYYSKACRMKK